MNITQNKVATITYSVKTQDGALVDQATDDAPLDYLHGHNNLIPGLETALEGKVAGDVFSATVAPADAYGEYNDAMVQRVPKEAFGGMENLEVGMRFMAQTPAGDVPVEITEVGEKDVVVDGNHMIAGKTLSFEVKVVDVRDATEDEIAQGHLQAEQGCGCGGGSCGCGSHDDDEDGCGCGGHENQEEKEEGCCGGHGGHGNGGCGCGH